MLKFKVLALIVASSAALAACQKSQETHDAGPGLKNVFAHNEGVLTYGLSNADLAKADALDGIPLDVKTQCASQICGDPAATSAPSDILRGDFSDVPEVRKMLDSDLKPSLTKLFDTNILSQKKFYEKLADRLPQLSGVKLSPQYTAAVNWLWMLSQSSMLTSALRGTIGNYTVDSQTIATANPSYSQADVKFLAAVATDIFNSNEYQALYLLSQAGLASFLNMEYQGLTTSEAEKQFAPGLVRATNVVQAAFPEMNYKVSDGVKALQDGKDITPEIEDGVVTAVYMAMFARAITQQVDLYSSRAIPVQSIVASAEANGLIAKGKEALNDQKNIDQERTAGLDQCRIYLEETYLAAPTMAELANASDLARNVKESVLRVSDGLNSDDPARASVTDYLSQVSFNFPPSRDDVMASVKATIGDYLTTSQDQVKRMDQLNDQSLVLLLFSVGTNGSPKPSSTLKSACSELAPSGPTDVTLNLIRKINVSWATIRYPNYGAGIMAHELGHVVSWALQNNANTQDNYVSLKNCTESRHDKLLSQQAGLYQEEDFADVIGARAMQDLQSRNVTTDNFGCLLLGQNKTRWGINGLSMINAATSTDVHSADLFRTLQVQLDSGRKLPSECTNLITRFAPSANSTCAK